MDEGAVNFIDMLFTLVTVTNRIKGMDKPIVDDPLWKRIEPLLPQPKPRREKYPGHKQAPDRAALSGILKFAAWPHLPEHPPAICSAFLKLSPSENHCA